jgi:hypothetical protein
MWESLFKHPRGRLSTRKYLSIATALLVVCFAYIFATSPTTYAADATLSGDTITYEQNSYEKDQAPATGNESHGFTKGTIIYRYVEAAGSGNGGATKKAHLIYFGPGTDPATATTANYQTFTLRGQNQYSQPSSITSIALNSSTSATTSPGTSSCSIDGIGWIVCPITNFLAKGMDLIYGWISGFLKVAPLATNQDQALYRAWGYMRTIANVAFIAAFLVIIYSQITNAGLSNYDIKKMLPRIVIAAILVNTSYWICAIAVDVFNILGYSLQDLFIMIRNSLVGSEGNSWDVISWEGMSSLILSGGSILGGASIASYLGITAVGGALAGATTIGAGISALIFLLLPLLISILFIVLVTFLILAARQAIITILIIVAPLAFVAFLLPNTEKWFEKWRSTFFTLLLVFPAFSLIFGASQLASAAIIQNAHGADALNIILLGMAVQVAPLAITPLLLRLGGGVLNRFAGIVNNPGKGIFDRGKNWAKDRSAANQAAGMAALAERSKRMGYPGARPTSSRRGLRGRAENAAMRLNPNNMTYAREYGRRQREEMKSANEAVTAGVFTQTGAGRAIYNRNQDAGLEKHAGDEANFRSYKGAMATGTDARNTYRRHLHHQAHIDKGFGDIYEESMMNHAELDLRGQVARNVGGIGDIRVQSIVDAGLADNKKKLVDAQGSLALKQTIEGDRALTQEVIMTTRMDKQASDYDSIVQKAADAAYDNYSRTNQAAQELRLRSAEQTDQAKLAESQWNSLIENVRAKGAASTEVFTANTSLAGAIKQLQADVEVETKRQESFQIEQRGNLAEMFDQDATIRLRAGGDTDQGAARVYAKAKSEINSGYMENVKNNRSVISDYSLNELMRLSIDGEKRIRDASGNITWVTATEEEKMAAYQEVLLTKGNNWAAQKLKDKIAEKGMVYDEDTGNFYDNEADRDAGTNVLSETEVGSRRTEQQIFIDAFKQSKLDIASTSGSDKSDMESGLFRTNSKDAIVRDLKQKKIKSDRWVKTDMDELQRMVQILRDDSVREDLANNNPETLTAMIETIQTSLTDRRISEHIDGRNQDLMRVIQGYAENARDTAGGTMSVGDKQVIEDRAETKVPTEYDPNKMYTRGDPTGPA